MTGMKLHKDAVRIEQQLNALVDVTMQKKGSQLADIDMIYVQPIRFSFSILNQVLNEGKVSNPGKYKMLEVIQEFEPYGDSILKQLQDPVRENFCNELYKLVEIETGH